MTHTNNQQPISTLPLWIIGGAIVAFLGYLYVKGDMEEKALEEKQRVATIAFNDSIQRLEEKRLSKYNAAGGFERYNELKSELEAKYRKLAESCMETSSVTKGRRKGYSSYGMNANKLEEVMTTHGLQKVSMNHYEGYIQGHKMIVKHNPTPSSNGWKHGWEVTYVE